MNEQDKIIVFHRYANAIDANIAKTKLDAHDIHCFLTEENTANLYPVGGILLAGVRLHIFEADVKRVEEILGQPGKY